MSHQIFAVSVPNTVSSFSGNMISNFVYSLFKIIPYSIMQSHIRYHTLRQLDTSILQKLR
jgi:hypothetical protein